MSHSESIKELAKALTAVQRELKPAAFNATNDFLKNRYADLGQVIEAGRELLAANGLSYSQLVTGGGEEIGVTTMLMHESGEWLDTTVTLPVGDERGKSRAQVAGSIITYLRRYSLVAILGSYSDEDTDGRTAPAQETTTASKPQAKAATPAKQPASMTEAAKELGGVEVTPEVQAAMDLKTGAGTRFGDLKDSQLELVINDPKYKKDVVRAANLVLNYRIANGITK